MRFLLLTALIAAANAECFGSGGVTICDKATGVTFTLDINGDCDDNSGNIASNAATYFSGDEYTYQGGACESNGTFKFHAILGVSNIAKAQKMESDSLGAMVSFIGVEVGDIEQSGSGPDATDPPAPTPTLCNGGPVYVSGTPSDDGPYAEDAETPQGHVTYTYGGNAIFRGEGTWNIQTSEGVYDSHMEELRTGDFGNGFRLSCEEASIELIELQKQIAQLLADKKALQDEVAAADEAKRAADLAKQAAEEAKDAIQITLNQCRADNGVDACPPIPECPEPEPCDVCPIVPDDCPANYMCDPCATCDVCEDCEDCPAQGCHNDMSSPVKFGAEYWFCDELLPSDCNHVVHGENVSNACRQLCGSCGDEVCAEKYHTKVLIEDIGSMYCDQIYPEECEIPEVASTCCRTCD